MAPSNRLFLGLDVGGTKTFCLVIDNTGEVRGFGRSGTGSFEYHGVEPAREENRKAIDAALDDAGIQRAELTGAGLGVAGADVPDDFTMLEREIYTPLLGDLPRVFRNDSFAALRGGTRDPFGIAIACGTDTVCAGRNAEGRETRVGGFGPEFGNECSGVLIGRAALNAVWQAREDVIPSTALTEKILARSGHADLDSLFLAMYRGGFTPDNLEPIAPLVFEAAVEGDAKACDILQSGGRFLGKMVNAAARALEMESSVFDVVTAGSVFRDGAPVLIDALGDTVAGVCPKARLCRPVYEPVVGAALMGMDDNTTAQEAFHSRLTASLDEAEKRYGVPFLTGELI